MIQRPESLRLIADDLTGALDSASAFVRVFGPLDIGIRAQPDGGVLDSATRECDVVTAAARLKALAPCLEHAPGRLSFFKVDSLLRGHAGTELAALLACNRYAHVIIAPAMPFQGRTTREGRQCVARDGRVVPTGEDIVATLLALEVPVQIRASDQALQQGVTLFNAETDCDLDKIVSAGLMASGSVLWVGTGGLCAALSRAFGAHVDPFVPSLEPPFLALVGTDHPVTHDQIARMPEYRLEITQADERSARAATALMNERDAAIITCVFPEGQDRNGARREITTRFGDLVRQLPAPGLLFVSGGETLRRLMAPLGARGLRVFSQIEPGMPLSRIVGGPWDGVMVLSKSGAFGAPNILKTYLDPCRGGKRALRA